MVPKIATAYDQNPARIALVLKDRRRETRKKRPALTPMAVTIGLMALFAINHFTI